MTTRLNISVPDELAKTVRDCHLNISQICQVALERAIGGNPIDRLIGDNARLKKENAKLRLALTDILNVAGHARDSTQ